MKTSPLQRPLSTNAIPCALYTLIGAYFSLNCIRFGKPFMNWSDYILFAEKLPYQARCLMALVYGLSEKLLQHLPISLNIGGKIPGSVSNPNHATTLLLVTTLSFAVCCLCAQHLHNKLFGRKKDSSLNPIQDVSTILPVVCMIFSVFVLNPNLNFILPYDMPSTAFQFVLLSLIIGRTPIWIIIIIFGLATLNRETTLLVCVFLCVKTFLLLKCSLPCKYYLRLALITACLWLGIRLALRIAFSSTTSEESPRIILNLSYILKAYHIPAILPLISLALIMLAATFVLLHDWNARFRSFAQINCFALGITGVLGFCMLCIFAIIIELRAFGDLIPYTFLSLCYLIERKSKDIMCASQLT